MNQSTIHVKAPGGEGPGAMYSSRTSFADSPAIDSTADPLDFSLSAEAQRLRLIRALHRGPVTTMAARRTLAIMHPAMRIRELRQDGYSIKTFWSEEVDAIGVVHRQGKYVLDGGDREQLPPFGVLVALLHDAPHRLGFELRHDDGPAPLVRFKPDQPWRRVEGMSSPDLRRVCRALERRGYGPATDHLEHVLIALRQRSVAGAAEAQP